MARRRRGRGGPAGGGRGDTGVGNWVVPAGVLGSDGTFSAASVWGVEQQPSAGTPVGVVLSQIPVPPGNSPAPPIVDEIQIQAVHGELVLYPAGASVGRVAVSAGLFLSKFQRGIGKWDVMDPGSQLDAQRNEWIHLVTSAVDNLVIDTAIGIYRERPVVVPFSLRFGMRIGDGEQLVLALGVNVESALVVANVRTHYRIQ